MDAGRGKRISDETIGALSEVIAEELEESPEVQFYAWKIHDAIENRVWLSLSDDEAEKWDSVSGGHVTIVAWGYAKLREHSA